MPPEVLHKHSIRVFKNKKICLARVSRVARCQPSDLGTVSQKKEKKFGDKFGISGDAGTIC